MLKLFVISFFFISSTINLFGQTKNDNFFGKYKVSSFIDLSSIKAIEIHDLNTNKTWLINQQSLRLVKETLATSYYVNQLFLKPGHLLIKFIGPQNLKGYDTYMYNDGIYFDPFRYDKYGKLINNNKPVSIILTRTIDWVKLK